MRTLLTGLSIAVLLTAGCCKTKKELEANTIKTKTLPMPKATLQTIVYKTKADYSKYVPVTMNTEKTAIVSYPAPQDVTFNGALAYPVFLAKGYLLDNRGLNPNSVFLKITYDEYSKLKTAPALSSMMGMIIDKDPFTEMYDLGNRKSYTDEVNQLNDIINKGGLSKYKQLVGAK